MAQVTVDAPSHILPDSPESVALSLFFWIVSAEKSQALDQRNVPPRKYALDLYAQCLAVVIGAAAVATPVVGGLIEMLN